MILTQVLNGMAAEEVFMEKLFGTV